MINLYFINMKTIQSFFLTIIFTAISLQTNAQRNFTVAANSTFEVAGTSTVHDWVMKSTEGTGNATLIIKDSKLAGINSLSVSLLAESLKATKQAWIKWHMKQWILKHINTLSMF